ncbi:tetratricopeptide (TPR) repeat protein [Sphingobium sp. B7D2B]|uniref:porin family protein n=1 Tax=Sphingobium sp. B7D2B TaxID=2940583 RepID=UPI002224C049|nr:porin family protein [Sphingobium sp. B7D2B]MCW2367310.1 tetratricopeptide (TPR) repeat protein [Sphingobium sp. B7D2B]
MLMSQVGAMAMAGTPTAIAAHPDAAASSAPEAAAPAAVVSVSAEAYAERLARNPANPELRFRLGMALMEAGRTREAIRQFRHLLADQPQAVRVRLELARAYYVARDYANAERQFRLAGAANLPAIVSANVDRYLKSIREMRSWSFSASFALAPDTNINAATAAETIELYGLPFDLSEAARRSSGVGVYGQIGAEWAPRLSARVRQRFGAFLSRRDYQGQQFDDMVLSAYLGPRVTLGRFALATAGTASRRWYGGQPYSRMLGGQADVAYYPGTRTAISLQASASDLRHEGATHLNGALLGLSLGVTRSLDKQSLGNLRVGINRHDAANRAFAQTSYTAGAIYARELPMGFSLSLQPGFSYSRFDGVFAAFGAARSDTSYSLGVSALNRKVTLGRFVPRVGVSHTINESNIALYAYRRTRFDIGVTTIF